MRCDAAAAFRRRRRRVARRPPTSASISHVPPSGVNGGAGSLPSPELWVLRRAPRGEATTRQRQLKDMAEQLPEGGAGAGALKQNTLPPLSEWIEQDEPGVYITLTALPGGVRDLKWIRFSRRRFSETQAGQWWEENRARVYEQYTVHVVDKPVASVATENGTRLPDSGTKLESEWVEQDEPGSPSPLLTRGARDLKRVWFRYIPITPIRNATMNQLKDSSIGHLSA